VSKTNRTATKFMGRAHWTANCYKEKAGINFPRRHTDTI